ncbi:FtsQ-type POTRA domain-containing protein [Agrococcus sp. TF02-05]|uniref:FtsQ-type POTRA domain-containing protein n=1 Tax=Agrococcus sp. TF02-05 TaxID=2815211 RepID=UPI001AA0E4CD|nr:FtsQ-type POTRA domain-containing protein [Agrococcus sp. TF02-05]MBO1770544.1 FtsQ-type POTRA domain-containing protein [Agrococcus sp. TF02-05]
MRRPDGFEPVEPEPRATEAEEAGERPVDLAELVRARREALEREAAEAVPQRRWALSAYGDLDEGEAADADGTDAGTAPVEPLVEGGSHAQRVDRAWREAEREQRRAERAEAREAARAARAAKRARVRRERAEVRRFTAARRRQLRTALLAVGGLAVALAALVGLVWSPLMSVREVRVEGTERLGAAAVQQALADSMGQPIATVTEEGVAARLRSIPQIESFRVDIVPPSTVIVRIVEREPAAIVPGDAGEVVIDAAGVVLGGVDESTAALPRLDGVAVGTEEFEAAATVLVSVPRSVLEATATIAAPTPSDIQLSLHSGQTVLWGGADESQLKADVLAALLETQDPALAVILDVSAPETPVVRGS